MIKEKMDAAMLSVVSNIGLTIMKIAVGISTGSVSILSEAVHSGMDLLASCIAFFSVKVSDSPPDKEHPYGHGKIENVSGVIEALLIFGASFWIMEEAINKIITGGGNIESIGIGSLVMFISAIVNIIVSKKLYRVAKKTNSMALEADALHLKADVYTSLGVGVGLFLIWLTGFNILDPIIAILVSIFILHEAGGLLRNAFAPLLGRSIHDDDIAIITEVFNNKEVKFHDLKTRISGKHKFAEVHMELPGISSLYYAHAMCDIIEEELSQRIDYFSINIHVEPETKNIENKVEMEEIAKILSNEDMNKNFVSKMEKYADIMNTDFNEANIFLNSVLNNDLATKEVKAYASYVLENSLPKVEWIIALHKEKN